MEVIRGNKTLSGTWGELWINGEKIFEFSKIEMKVTANREDVQLGIDVDSKITGLKGEGSYTVKKYIPEQRKSWRTGKRAWMSVQRLLRSWQILMLLEVRSNAGLVIMYGTMRFRL